EAARRLSMQALLPYADKKPPALRASVVALAVALGTPPPKAGKGDGDAVLFGTIEGHHVAGNPQAARAAITGKLVQADEFRAAVLAGDHERAMTLGANALPVSVDWLRLRLAKEAGDATRLAPLLDAAESPDVGAWGRLVLLRRRLAESKSVVGEEALEGLPPTLVAGLLARMELARHNCRLDSGWSAKLKEWDDPARALGWLGAAQAMQR
ncbi:MAG: hypothetical protein K2W96_28860, partial [Gemmataceae bacterium]|nr:hypothetical protein [Gemmataceae bacterium]